ncbi:MAG: carotenoid 1,2-hydratase [Pseudomonadota bacterium]
MAGQPGPLFTAPVEPGGYRWWYLDGLSDDARFGVTVIALLGSVFSPYYAWAGRRDPLDHISMNVCLYDREGSLGRWSMTERRRSALQRHGDQLTIARSSLAWRDGAFHLQVDERCAPWPSPLRGQIRLTPETINERVFALDAAGRHHWQPIAPTARLEVDFTQPELSWRGQGYMDSNVGTEPLEAGFQRWDWSRSAQDGEALVLYDAMARDGARRSLALRFDAEGGVEERAAPPPAALPSTRYWGIARGTQADRPDAARLLATFENTPFYARSLIESEIDGTRAVSFHESLDLDRFSRGWVRFLLPFRMPRRFL